MSIASSSHGQFVRSFASFATPIGGHVLLTALLMFLLMVLVPMGAQGQNVTLTPYITTVAGTGAQGCGGDGLATSVDLNLPGAILDNAGNLYISGGSCNVVRVVNTQMAGIAVDGVYIPSGSIATVAGGGTGCVNQTDTWGDGCPATSALLNDPRGIAHDSVGNMYILDTGDNLLRKVDTNGIISTIAGNGQACSNTTSSISPCGDGGPAISAQFNQPVGLSMDSAGNFYIGDELDHRVREILTNGTITTVAGNGTDGYSGDGFAATVAQIGVVAGAYVDANNNLYLADFEYNTIRKVDAGGTITTIVGIPGVVGGYSADGTPAASAILNSPHSPILDSTGTLYFLDAGNNVLRRVDAGGYLRTVVGTGTPCAPTTVSCGDGGPAITADLNFPVIVQIDSGGNFYISDYADNRIREVVNGPVSFFNVPVGSSNSELVRLSFNVPMTLSGGAQVTLSDFGAPQLQGTCDPSISAPTICQWLVAFTPSQPGPRWGSFVVTDNAGNKYNFPLVGTGMASAAAFTPGIINTVAGGGNGMNGLGDGGSAIGADLLGPWGLAVDSAGNLFIADSGNERIRKVDTTGTITTVAGSGTSAGYTGDGGFATQATLHAPEGVALDAAGNIFIADYTNNAIREVFANTGKIQTIAGGNATGGYNGDNIPATGANLKGPTGVAVDKFGNVYIADQGNERIRKVDGNGIITTVAGGGGSSCTGTDFVGDGCPATGVGLNYPSAVAVDDARNLYIAELFGLRIRKVDINGIISTIAGTGTAGYNGDSITATTAEINYVNGLAVDSAGDVYIADMDNYRVRMIANFTINTVAGNGGFTTVALNGDGGPAIYAQIDQPMGVAVDGAGNLYIADTSGLIRKVNVSTSAAALGTVNLGQSSSAPGILVSDVGNTPLHFSSINTGAGVQLQSGSCSVGTPVDVGLSCGLWPLFVPVSPGPIGTLTLTDDAVVPQVISLSGKGVATPTFSGLTPSQAVPYSTSAVNLSGMISATGPFYPPIGENVVINIGNQWQPATIGANGIFSASVPITSDPPGTYPITYSYAGDTYFTLASDATTSVTIGPAVPVYYTLTLTEVGTGTGTVADNQSLINCSESNGNPETGSCSANYASGSQVALTATAIAPSVFIGWAGACASFGSNPVCALQTTSAQSVTADFAPPPTSFTLPFNPGSNVTQMATYCLNGSNPCTDPNGHALSLTVPLVHQGAPGSPTFSLTVTATEYQADGLCPAGGNGQSGDLDCRFTSYFNFGPDLNANSIVPLCFPYANGNCVHYQVYVGTPGNEPNPSLYSGGIFWKIGFNNDTFLPAQGSYWGSNTTVSPRLLDDPDENEVPGLPYGTVCSTPMLVNGSPTSPPIYCQYDRDITTFYNLGTGLDNTIGGKTQQPNDVVVAFLPTISNNPTQQPPAQSAPVITSASCPNGCSISGNVVTFAEGAGGTFAITFTGYPTPSLSESGALPPGLTFSATTGLISGTPADGAMGSYPIMLTATNINGTASQSYMLAVAPTVLTITASSATMTYGGAPPTITPSYNGFVNGDSPASLTTKPTCTTTATSTSAPGTYPSMCSGAADPTYSINYVNGAVTVSGLEIMPTSVNFGTLYLGQIGVQAVTLTNKGSTAITITSAKITRPGNATGDFGDIALCPPMITVLPGTIAPGKSCTILVGTWAVLQIFSPTAATATLTINDSAAGSPHTVPMTEQVINPQASLSSYLVNFATQKVGTTTAAKSVTLTNTGTTSLNLGTLSVSGNFALASGTTCLNGGTVSPGTSCAINVTFTPTGKGVRLGSVKITDNAMINPQIIALSGTGN